MENLKRRQKRAMHATTSRYSTGLDPFCIRYIYSMRASFFTAKTEMRVKNEHVSEWVWEDRKSVWERETDS